MPNYDFECKTCETVVERNVPIAERTNQICIVCLEPLNQKISFRGAVWSPTATGANHR